MKTFCVVLFSVILAAGIFAASDATAGTKYTSKSSLYAFMIPDNWVVYLEKSRGADVVLVPRGEMRNGTGPGSILFVLSVPKGSLEYEVAELDVSGQQVLKYEYRMFRGARCLFKEIITPASNSISEQGHHNRIMCHFTLKLREGEIIPFTFMADGAFRRSQNARLVPDFWTIINGVEFRPGVKPTQ